MANKKESNRAKSVRLTKEEKSLLGGYFKQNNKDPNSNNSKNSNARLINALTKKDKLVFEKEKFRESMNYKWDNLKYRQERDTKKDNNKLERAQERQKEYKQKRKEYIGKSISGALESWKFKF